MAFEPLCTKDDVKLWLTQQQQATASDAQITDLIKAVSRFIGEYCGRDNLGAVLSYVERHPPKRMGLPQDRDPRVFCRRYPIVTLTQVTIGYNTGSGAFAVPLTTDPTASTGALIEPDSRTIVLLGVALYAYSGPIVVTYTAGYNPIGGTGAATGTPVSIPDGLRQAAVQWCGELMRIRKHITLKSQTLGGQSMTYDDGKAFGMTPRTKAMLEPFRDRAPGGLW